MKELVGKERKEKKPQKTEGMNEVRKYDNKKNEIHREKMKGSKGKL